MILRSFWLLVLAGHAAGAFAIWSLTAGGFPPGHPRFWTNSVLPWVIMAAALGAATRRGPGGVGRCRALRAAIAGAWLGAAVGARVVFPATFRVGWLVPMAPGIILAAAVLVGRDRPSLRSGAVLGGLVAGLALGAALPIALRAPAADTRPSERAAPRLPPDIVPIGDALAPVAASDCAVLPAKATVVCAAGRVTLEVQPMLTFFSCSPDGGMVNFADDRDAYPPRRELAGARREGARQTLFFGPPELGLAQLQIDAGADADGFAGPRVTRLDAVTTVPRTVWSHLNSFTQLRVTGHHRLSILFSPSPDRPIAVQPMDYPAGRPERFAYLDAGRIFHVVEARDAEKGPFRELASGPLQRDGTLTMTFLDQDVPVFRVALADWAAQAGTGLSPTAGWGIPVNAIEFSLEATTPSSAASIFVTLAATSVGRGFDSVGHRPGLYRNRVRIERLDEDPDQRRKK